MAFGKGKGTGKHSREERLKQLAQQMENGESFDDDVAESASADEKTVAVTTVMPAAPEIKQENTSVQGAVPAPVAGPTYPVDYEVESSQDKLAGFDIDASGYPVDPGSAEAGSFVAADFGDIPTKRKRKALKAFGITAGVIIALVLVAYIAGAVMFMGRFLPNTFINGNDVSMKTDDEVAQILDEAISSYQLDVLGNGFSYHTTSADIGLNVDSKAIVQSMHDDLNAWRWPLLLLESNHDESDKLVVAYQKDALEQNVSKQVKKYNKNAKAPVNATIAYDEKKKEFTVKPEEIGEQLDSDTVKASLNDAIAHLQPSVTLSADHLLQPAVFSTDEKLIESAKLATGMVSAQLTLKLDGQTVGDIDGSKLSQFIKIKDDLSVKFSNKEMKQWVDELLVGFDTIGTERHYTRADGKTIEVKGGTYGWEIDTEAAKEAIIEAIKEGRKTDIDIPCITTAETFSKSGERDWGNRYIDVDISEQHVRFYGDNGKIIWETDCITGVPDGKKDTWEGVWYVNNKESPSTLIGYTDTGKKEYETKVAYWMPFEGNGIGFHDAPWQPDFGGDMYATGYGSHGCVNLSSADAQELYSIIEIGDVVVVHS